MAKRALLMAEADDVATVIEAVCAGDTVAVETKQGEAVEELVSAHDIPRFHKIALRDMAAHDIVHKYGQVIGEATAPIKRGDYVHIHNIESIKTGLER